MLSDAENVRSGCNTRSTGVNLIRRFGRRLIIGLISLINEVLNVGVPESLHPSF